MEKRVRMNLLYDLYGALITDKRSEALRLSLEEDYSLVEIAEMTGVSRQAVHESITRAEEKLEAYENTLHMLEHDLRERDLLRKAVALLDQGDIPGAREVLTGLIEEGNE